MNAIVVNDLSLDTELDAQALAEIVGGHHFGGWKFWKTCYKFTGIKRKRGKYWYKKVKRYDKYVKCLLKKKFKGYEWIRC